VDERDLHAEETLPRRGVDQLGALALEARELARKVVDLVRDMVHAGPAAREEKVERFWRLGQVVTAIAGAGLVVRQLEEYPGAGTWRRLTSRVPGRFTLLARKP